MRQKSAFQQRQPSVAIQESTQTLSHTEANCDKIEAQQHAHALTTRNLAQLEHDLLQLERFLIPLLNQVRAMQNKKPVIVPNK